MTQRDKWAKRPAVMRYRQFCDAVRAADIEVRPGMRYVFGLPMPKSWSKKKRLAMCGQPHESRPDLDNMLKALWDAAAKEDCHIHSIAHASKVWADAGYIQLGSLE